MAYVNLSTFVSDHSFRHHSQAASSTTPLLPSLLAATAAVSAVLWYDTIPRAADFIPYYVMVPIHEGVGANNNKDPLAYSPGRTHVMVVAAQGAARRVGQVR